MKNIVTIGGSNSKNSINKVLAEYVGGLVKNVNLTKVDLNNYEMPLFSVDIEAEKGLSSGVLALNEVIENVDGFIISLAEHNGAYSVAFKNALIGYLELMVRFGATNQCCYWQLLLVHVEENRCWILL